MYKPGGTIADLLERIRKNQYVLPAIQREFVWRPTQIERLFDSLMQGYPFSRLPPLPASNASIVPVRRARTW